MLVPDIKLGICCLSTVGIMRRESSFSWSYPILPYTFSLHGKVSYAKHS